MAWEWPFICNSSTSLTGYIFSPQSSASSPRSDRHMIPELLRSILKETSGNLNLIASDVTTLTASVLLKLKQQSDP